jgi:hypothetical protein
VQLDSEKSYSALVYNTSVGFAIWISSIVVSALDSIPLVCGRSFVVPFFLFPLAVEITLGDGSCWPWFHNLKHISSNPVRR